MNSDDKKRLLKKFKVQYKNKDEPIDLELAKLLLKKKTFNYDQYCSRLDGM